MSVETRGAGVIYTDPAMMAGVATVFEECAGKRSHRYVGEAASAS
jgi:hypothetical protein